MVITSTASNMETKNKVISYIIILSVCLISMFFEESELRKLQKVDQVRFKRTFNRHGFYLFGNDSSEFITIPNLFPGSYEDHTEVTKVQTTHPYKTYSQYTTDTITESSTQTTTSPTLRLLPAEKVVDKDSSSAKNTEKGPNLKPPKITQLMQDIEEKLMSQEATLFLKSLQNDFQRMVVLTNMYSCPFVSLCKFSLSLSYIDYDFSIKPVCCEKCSCIKEECVLKGNCCPDVDWFVYKPRVLSQGVEEKCLPTGIRPWKDTGEHIKALTGCPLYASPEIVNKCVRHYSSISKDDQFEDIVMVTDGSTKYIYRNKYCAMCNYVNASRLIYWSAELVCKSEPSIIKSAFETLTVVFSGELDCDVEFIEPGVLDVPPVSCSYAISTCNVTGLWADYDQVTDTACAMYGSYVHKDYQTAFRNIFCAHCNGYRLQHDDVCRFRYSQSIYTKTFSRLLLLKEKPEKSENQRDEKTNTECGTGELFDHVKRKCRVVRCSPGRQIEDGKCNLFDESTRNFTIDMKIRLLTTSGLLLTDAYNMVPEITKALGELVDDMFGTAVDICGSQVVLASNIETALISDVDATGLISVTENIKINKLKRLIEKAELKYYDIRLQLMVVSKLDKIPKVMSQIKESIVLFRIIDKSIDEEVFTHLYSKNKTIVSKIPRNLSLESDPISNSYFIFQIYPANGVHSDNFDFIAKTGYYLLSDDRYEGQEVVRIDNVLSFLSLLQNLNGTVHFPFLRWNDKLAFCKFNEDSRDLSTFLDCPMFIIPWSEMSWIETADGLEFIDSSIRLDISEFSIERADDFSTRLMICVDTYYKKFSTGKSPETKQVGPLVKAKFFISIISVSASIVCLTISLVTFCMFKQLQTVPGKNNMALIISLLFAQFLYVLGSVGGFDTNGNICKTIGLLTHFFWLLSILWMNVCTFHMFRVLLRTRNVANVPDTRKNLFYHGYCIALATIFVLTNVTVSMISSENSDIGYGKVICYVSTQTMIEVTFGIPAAIVVGSNLGMFLAIVIKLKKTPTIQKNVKNERNYLLVFVKLSMVTGATWIFGFVYMWSKFEVFSFLFIIFNASQGVFIMLAFVVNKRTFGLYQTRFSGERTIESNAQRTTLTASTTA